MKNAEPVLLGVGSIAEYCGVTKERVRTWIAENPDFPARREGGNGAWLSTGRALGIWLDDYVRRPRIPGNQRNGGKRGRR